VNQLFIYRSCAHVLCATAARVLQTLPCGNDIRGMTSLGNLLYVLRDYKSSDQIEVYDKDSYSLRHTLTVPALDSGADVTVCGHNRCAYVSDGGNECVHKVSLPAGADVRSWPVNDTPARLSVTSSYSVLVTCREISKIKEFSADGQLLLQIQLPGDVASPRHTVQLSRRHLIVCHGQPGDKSLGVCLLGAEGQLVKSYAGSSGSDSQQITVPRHLAIDRNGYVFVADNCRVLLLSSSLTFIREVASLDQLNGWPPRLCLDEEKNRLYVAVNEVRGMGGHVVVVSI